METGGSPLIFTVLIFVIILYCGIVVYFANRRQVYLGLIMPSVFALVALYNFLKPLLIPNPYPTMKEALFTTFFGVLSIVGFIVFGINKYLFKNR
jgi:hypothetical protein